GPNEIGKGGATTAAGAEAEKEIEMPLLLQNLQNIMVLGVCSENEAKLALVQTGGEVNQAMNNILAGPNANNQNQSDVQVAEQWNGLFQRLNITELVDAYEKQQAKKKLREQQAKIKESAKEAKAPQLDDVSVMANQYLGQGPIDDSIGGAGAAAAAAAA